MHLLGVFDDGDLVVIRAEVGGGVRHRHGNELAEIVRRGRIQSGQTVDKFAYTREVGGVGWIIERTVGVVGHAEVAGDACLHNSVNELPFTDPGSRHSLGPHDQQGREKRKTDQPCRRLSQGRPPAGVLILPNRIERSQRLPVSRIHFFTPLPFCSDWIAGTPSFAAGALCIGPPSTAAGALNPFALARSAAA